MRLKTKFQDEDFELGEVVNANIYYGGSDRIKIVATSKRGGEHSFYYESLKELSKMFEDAPEEPKDFWYIDDFMIMCGTEGEFTTPDLASFTKKDIEKLKEIGNYFESKEEAEAAVEKLRAWKRLKDKGFGFYGYNFHDILSGVINIKAEFENSSDTQIAKDLDLLFCPEVKNEKVKED